MRSLDHIESSDARELASTMFSTKFYSNLILFVNSFSSFFYNIFEKMPREKLNEFYSVLFEELIMKYGSKLQKDFLDL